MKMKNTSRLFVSLIVCLAVMFDGLMISAFAKDNIVDDALLHADADEETLALLQEEPATDSALEIDPVEIDQTVDAISEGCEYVNNEDAGEPEEENDHFDADVSDNTLDNEGYIEDSQFRYYRPYVGATYELRYHIRYDDTICIHGFRGISSGRLTIPDKIDGHAVKRIDALSFYEFDIVNGRIVGTSGFTGELALPEGLEEIDDSAFKWCFGFTGDLIIPDSVIRIGNDAFCDCDGFTGKLMLPNGIKTIEGGAFCYCDGFTGALSIPDSVTAIEEMAFYDCSGFSGEFTIPESVVYIGEEAFGGCKQLSGELTIPGSVVYIGRGAFARCNGLTGTFTVPSSIVYMDGSIIHGCSSITKVVNRSEKTFLLPEVDGKKWANESNGNIVNRVTNGTAIRSDRTEEDPSIIEPEEKQFAPYKYVINDDNNSVTITGLADENAVIENPKLPDSIENMPVTVIGDGAFRRKGLKGTLSLPRNLITVGDSAFSGCEQLSGKLTIPNGVKWIEPYAFSDCGFSGELVIPEGVILIGKYALGDGINGSGFTGNLNIPKSVKVIDECAFDGFGRMTGDIIIPEGVQVLGYAVFSPSNGGGLSYSGKLVIPKSLKYGGLGFLHSSYGIDRIENNSDVMIYTSDFLRRKGDYYRTKSGEEATWEDDDEYLISENGKKFPYGELIGKGIYTRSKSLIHVKSVSLNVNECDIFTGKEITLKASISPENASNKKISWKSSKPDVATVSSAGVVKGIKPGKTTVTVTTADNNKTASCVVTVKDTSNPDNPKPVAKTSIKDAKIVLSKTKYTFNGKVNRPEIKTIGGMKLKEGTDYIAKWSNARSKKAGTYKVTVTGKGNYTGTAKASYRIKKAANPMKIKARTAKVEEAAVKKETQKLKVSKVLQFTKKPKGSVTYEKVSGNKKITINNKSGRVTVKKGLKKGVYPVTVKVTAFGNNNYGMKLRVLTFKVKVK